MSQLRTDRVFDPPHQRSELLGGAPRRQDLRLKARDALRALLELGDELGDVIGQRDGLGEPLLLGARCAQLGFERPYVGLALRKLRGDLGPDLCEHRLQNALAEDVLLQVVDQRTLDLSHRLMHGDRADGVAALVVSRAAIAEDAGVATTERAHTRRADRATACTALRDAGQRVFRRGAAGAQARAARREPLLHGEPDRVIDNAHSGRSTVITSRGSAFTRMMPPPWRTFLIRPWMYTPR